ncbi:MMPL family transporter [Microbispora bryophytorum]|uniref:Putative membrane protein ActII-3 n=1 Tax=Microbispora bryophytorum TaxID=1460882 RepID=A0A8H9H5W2_9ACTN|nr:MMPL family transporter [Microbispora bryophytorum]TQR99198.1 MMPL family transporter [Microbispora bryophytorum]GGO31855.1 putative membrane protein ActII-3 [Microbispora bryophytorum]
MVASEAGDPMRLLTRASVIAAGRRSRWVVIAVWLALAMLALPLQAKLDERAADESETFLVRGSESAAVKRIVDERFRRGSETAAVIAYFREGGITADDGRRADTDALALCGSGAIPNLTMVATPYQRACGETDPLDMSAGGSLLTSPDDTVILSTVLMTDDSTPDVEQAVAAIREVVPPATGDESGLRAFVTGRAGFEADRQAALGGINGTLLAVTVAVLLLLLLVTYRSPLVALVPLAVVALAYLVTSGLAYGLVAADLTDISGQTTSILVVLMFGAGTDYCLLIVARFRDELRRTRDVEEAMVAAAQRTAPAILSAGAIVVGTMMVLALADFNATREMGPILALGVAIMVCAGLTLLPAVLTALGRRAFWPAVPRLEPESAPAVTFWGRVAGLVHARPGVIAAAVTAVLAAGALAGIGGRPALDFSESFREAPDSVRGQQVIRDHFIPGRAAPLRIVVADEVGGKVQSALTEGTHTPVADMHAVARSAGADGLLIFDADLRMDPFSEQSTDAVPVLREVAERAADGQTVLIGGTVAENYDARQALGRDTRLIVPVSLALILVVLAVLLRAVVMPLYVIATVILSFGFALGVSSLIFTHLLGQPASDPNLPIYAFIFLVALGVDYNVFLLSRITERRRQHETRRAVTEALERTGGVITSAGLVLAATFATLMVLPMEALFQIGFVVTLGLLADTFLVRALLVPALAMMLGERNWWPFKQTATPG